MIRVPSFPCLLSPSLPLSRRRRWFCTSPPPQEKGPKQHHGPMFMPESIRLTVQYFTMFVTEKSRRAWRWFGDDETREVNYVKDMSSLPNDDIPLESRRYLDKVENVAAPDGRRTSGLERQRLAGLFRFSRAKEDSSNYKKSTREKRSDVFRPHSLQEFHVVVDSQIRAGIVNNRTRDVDYVEPEEKVKGVSLTTAVYETEHLHPSDVIVNNLMIRNNILPRWIELSHVIRDEQQELVEEVRSVYLRWKNDVRYRAVGFRNYPVWRQVEPLIAERVTNLNKVILDYNLIVPCLNLQKCGVFVETFIQYLEEEEKLLAGEKPSNEEQVKM